MKRVILAISIVAVFLTLQGKKQSTYVVTMTSSGFSPKMMTMPIGATVDFVNTDTENHWPASDFHPDHTIYPAFDPKRTIAPGKSWSFRPTLVGVFRYHDHDFHYRKGTVTVTGEGPTSQGALSSFIANFFDHLAPSYDANRFRQLPEVKKYAVLRQIINQKGTLAAWEFLNSIYPDTGIPTPEQHNLAHFMGRKFFEGSGMEGMAHCTPLFSYGCYDGVAERAFTGNLDALPDLDKTCRRFGPKGSLLVISCMHGLGHGIATLMDTAKIEDVLTACDRLVGYEASCHSGIFMEYDLGVLDGTYPARVTKDDPIAFCNNFVPKHRLACTARMIYLMEKDYGVKFQNIVGSCLGQKDQTTRDDCIESIGQRESKKANGDIGRIFSKCREISDGIFQNRCITTALSATVVHQYKGWESALGACDQLSGSFVPACRKRVEEAISIYR